MVKTFFFPWMGHKYREAKILFTHCKLEKIKTIVEPFCGACGFSIYGILKNITDKNMKYIFNDIDQDLVLFLNDVKKGKLKKYIKYYNDNIEMYYDDIEQWRLFKKKNNLTKYEWFLFNRVSIRGGMLVNYNLKIKRNTSHKMIYDDFVDLENIFMSDNVKITNYDYTIIMNKYKFRSDVLLYIDPPYLDSFNSKYTGYGKNDKNDKSGMITDNTGIYVYLKKFIKGCYCKVLFSINDNMLNRYLYNKFIITSTKKTYGLTFKKSNHLIIGQFEDLNYVL